MPSLIIDPLRILKGVSCRSCAARDIPFIDYRSVEDTESFGDRAARLRSRQPSLIIDPLRILKEDAVTTLMLHHDAFIDYRSVEDTESRCRSH